MRLILSLSALFLSVILLQLSSGTVGPLDALSGSALGFSRGEIGMLGSSHFIGFFIGCWGAPRLMGRVGHARAFAAFTALGAMGLLAHMLVTNPYAWALMRIASGLCIAGCYTVIEGWLMARITNADRGRVTGIYRVADMSASLAAQLLIGVLAPASYVSYNILAILCCAALLPLALSRAPAPEMPEAPRLRPRLALERSPLAVVAVVVSALSGATFRMIGPIYGQEIGLDKTQIAWFLGFYVLGGALVQYPAGWLADKFDRRWILIVISLLTMASCLASALTSGSPASAQWNAFIFGATSFPVYSIATAHAHDFADTSERAELSAALLFYYAVGAIAAPYLASQLIVLYGPAAIFGMIALGHAALLAYGFKRMRIRPSRPIAERTRYTYAPRTSFVIGRLLRGRRERD
ncbi:MFS transporter [Pseudooceanicola algae]|uniref:Putative MFS-type transporter YcaD n=1 Tax=Pseudooceanicola algae TaxID=1537215 RepID=A0A418SCP9_9RHOB|nr:MFS transporter [Pseudooceanicola algae]QPM90103.1 putative MFS-type transporter YcaD [Pseudooceanicola algae]